MSYQAVVGGVLVAGLGFAAYLALSKDDSNMNDAGDYDFNAQGIDAAIGRMNTAIENYFVNTEVPVDQTVTPPMAAEIATVSEQQDAIYTPNAEIPIYQQYGTVNDALKGWQADLESVGGPAVVYIDAFLQGTSTKGSIYNNALNAAQNAINAQTAEGMINFAKWADYEEAKNANSTTMDLSEMEQMAAWLYVNDRKDYDSFTSAWKTMAGIQSTTNSSGMRTETYSAIPAYSNLAWSAQEESNIKGYIQQLQSQPKIAQYGDFASTPAPYTTDIQGNAVNAYTGVIMVGDQGPTGGKY